MEYSFFLLFLETQSGNVMLTGGRAAQVMDYLAPTGMDKATAFANSMRTDEV